MTPADRIAGSGPDSAIRRVRAAVVNVIGAQGVSLPDLDDMLDELTVAAVDAMADADTTPTARLRRPAEVAPLDEPSTAAPCFPAGSVVRLRSGGPALTVRTTTEEGVHVAWMSSDGVPFDGVYAAAMLEAAVAPLPPSIGRGCWVHRGNRWRQYIVVGQDSECFHVRLVTDPPHYTPMRVPADEVRWEDPEAGHTHTVDPAPRHVRVQIENAAPFHGNVIGSPCPGMLTVRVLNGEEHTVGERWCTDLPASPRPPATEHPG